MRNLQVILSFKCFRTNRADIFPLIRMCEFVFCQCAWVVELFSTDRTWNSPHSTGTWLSRPTFSTWLVSSNTNSAWGWHAGRVRYRTTTLTCLSTLINILWNTNVNIIQSISRGIQKVLHLAREVYETYCERQQCCLLINEWKQWK